VDRIGAGGEAGQNSAAHAAAGVGRDQLQNLVELEL
jgi:hypothetical protein